MRSFISYVNVLFTFSDILPPGPPDPESIPPAYEDVVNESEPAHESSPEQTPSLNGVCESPLPTPVIIVDEEELTR